MRASSPVTILTLGGGGFSMTGGPTALDRFLVELTGRERPRVCFVPTASGDAQSYAEAFDTAYADLAEPHVLSLFDTVDDTDLAGTVTRSPEIVREMDAVFVGGGSTANLLAVWRVHDLDGHLAAAAAAGTVLSGVSAGMNCWFEASSTDSFGPLAPLRDGLGWLPGSACPHYFGEADRQAAYLGWVTSGDLPDGWAADDGAALLWRDGELVEVVAERPDAQAFRVVRDGDRAVETPLPVRSLPPATMTG